MGLPTRASFHAPMPHAPWVPAALGGGINDPPLGLHSRFNSHCSAYRIVSYFCTRTRTRTRTPTGARNGVRAPPGTSQARGELTKTRKKKKNRGGENPRPKKKKKNARKESEAEETERRTRTNEETRTSEKTRTNEKTWTNEEHERTSEEHERADYTNHKKQ